LAQKIDKFEPDNIIYRFMATYNWQMEGWPNFKWNEEKLDEILFSFVEKAGRVSGIFDAIPEDAQNETLIEIMVSEAIKTSEIEGELLSRQDVISSIRHNLGMKNEKETSDKRAMGISAVMVAVRENFSQPLDEEMMFHWHELLFRHVKGMVPGKWRTLEDPMQVISGAVGHFIVHFEAPPSVSVPDEMKRFIEWFNNTAPGGNFEIKRTPVKAAVAHLYFESIHPFEDGNGRIGRAIAEKALSQGLGRPVLLSLSKTIEKRRKTYYDELKQAQSSLDITRWVEYFVKTVLEAQTEARDMIVFTLNKVKYFDRFRNILNDRQTKVINRMFEEGPEGFVGGMNARKYGAICQVSKATATRDLQYLTDEGALVVSGAGRNTSYQVNL
jgi:Fic family protein